MSGPTEADEPLAGELVVTEPLDEQAVFTVLDKHDEQQILQELQDRALEVMLYDFTSGGRRMVDLSLAGVREAIRLMNNSGKCRISIVKDSLVVEEVTEDEGKGAASYYRATIMAEDEETGHAEYGSAVQEKHMKKRDGTVVWDRYAYTKAINKAQRNALKAFIPEGMRQTILAQYKDDPSALKRIESGVKAATLAELPAPDVTPEAQELRAEIEAAYGRLHALNPVRLTPGRYHDWKLQVSHDQERMRAMLAHIEQLTREEGKA